MKILYSFSLVLVMGMAFSQFSVSAELRPRFEFRNGYGTLMPNNTDAATFVSQRSRLNTHYLNEGLEVFLSLQDIRVWGDVKQLNNSDKNGAMIHQAWGKFNFGTGSSIKLGRQVISYDDQRFFGGVGWAQQARSHDAALYAYHNDTFKMDLGVAYNQDSEALFGSDLITSGTYKSMQYAWIHKDWVNFSGSLLLANIGWQYLDQVNPSYNETRFNQTIGTHLSYKKNGLGLNGNAYYQFGKDIMDNNLKAYLVGLDVDYQFNPNLKMGLGGEIQSGNDNNVITDGENKAFTPFFGTNHKFNGWMDYFYVGNHANSVGLVDLQLNANYKVQEKSNLSLAVHHFQTAADFKEETLGTELDMSFSHQLKKDVNLTVGYSHMFASDGMELLKGNTDGNTNHWAWAMVTINPTLFTSNK
ncbi:MAG: alginate export family protein [Weeksellaceae bacterium]